MQVFSSGATLSDSMSHTILPFCICLMQTQFPRCRKLVPCLRPTEAGYFLQLKVRTISMLVPLHNEQENSTGDTKYKRWEKDVACLLIRAELIR